jgi:hypothetical protein
VAPDVDTVTVVGILGRTADEARFVLTLPNGRSETLDVAAVKSAKKVAGAIGQAQVELELDVKLVPGTITQLFKSEPDRKWAYLDYNIWPWGPQVGPNVGPAGSHPAIEAAGLAPFVAASPHQAPPATIAALSYGSPGAHHHHQFIKPPHLDHHQFIKPPQLDPQVPPKQPSQDGTNPWNSFDFTGVGAIDVITYHQGMPIYHY